jgi:hypothetical protein
MSDGGFVAPRSEILVSGAKITRLGWIGNVFIGGVAGLLTWGLYGPFANVPLIKIDTEAVEHGAAAPNSQPSATGSSFDPKLPPVFTIGALLGAVLTGAGGSRVISDLVEKKVGEAARQATLDGTQKTIELLRQQLERLQDTKKG